MGISSRPGSVVVREIVHEPFEVHGVQYAVCELVWNSIDGRSYDLVRTAGHVTLTDESFDEYPTDTQIAAVLTDHGVDVELETCQLCHGEILRATAHRNRGGWVGDSCCWFPSETDAKDAVHQYRTVEVVIRNVITHGPLRKSKGAWLRSGGRGFTELFDNLDDARRFADDHKWFFNNCAVQVSYLAGFQTHIEQVPAYSGSWYAPMVNREVTYSVWRDVPGWKTGEPDSHIREHVHEPRSDKTAG